MGLKPVCFTALQALKVGADEALMLDPQGFVATCNSTNFFAVRKGEVSGRAADPLLATKQCARLSSRCRWRCMAVYGGYGVHN